MAENIHQVYVNNPITSNASTDLMYFGQSPYGVTDDAAMTYANFAAQFVLSNAIINGAHGGTGVNNGASTITIGGNVAFTGAHTFAGTLTADTAVTFPTSGTLATTTGTVTNATNAANVATTQVTANASYYPLMVVSSTNGNQACDLVTGFTYNPNTGSLTTTTFVGALTGNVTGNVSGSSGSCTGNAATASAVAVGGITGLGTGVATALALNVGSAGAPVTFNGAGGTPSSMTATNLTGTAAGLTAGTASAVAVGGITGLGTGVATALAATLNGSGALAATTNPTFVTPVLGAASATSLAFSSTTGLIGTTTNNSAATGSVGEFVSSVIAAGSPVSLSTGTAKDMTSLSLTAGDWDVWGNITFTSGGATNVTYVVSWLSLTSATLPDASLFNINNYGASGLVTGSVGLGCITPSIRVSVGTTTTIYISGQSGFSVNTMAMCGGIYARRVR